MILRRPDTQFSLWKLFLMLSIRVQSACPRFKAYAEGLRSVAYMGYERVRSMAKSCGSQRELRIKPHSTQGGIKIILRTMHYLTLLRGAVYQLMYLEEGLGYAENSSVVGFCDHGTCTLSYRLS